MRWTAFQSSGAWPPHDHRPGHRTARRRADTAENASFRVNPGDQIGLVGRNGAGKTTPDQGAGRGGAARRAARSPARGDVGYLPQDPRTGDLEVLARDRILSARGLDEVLRGMREAEGAMASADGATRDKAMKQYGRLEDASSRARRVRGRGRGRLDRLEPRPARPGARPAAAHAVRRPATPGRAGPHPVLRRRHAAARRADQPPRRRLDRVAARLPARPTRAA